MRVQHKVSVILGRVCTSEHKSTGNILLSNKFLSSESGPLLISHYEKITFLVSPFITQIERRREERRGRGSGELSPGYRAELVRLVLRRSRPEVCVCGEEGMRTSHFSSNEIYGDKTALVNTLSFFSMP